MEDDAPPGVPEWVVTYGDMMSLLLTFFIMLVSMSEIVAEQKYRAVLESLHKRLGYRFSPASAPGDSFPLNSFIDRVNTMKLGSFVETPPGTGGVRKDSTPGEESRVFTGPEGVGRRAGDVVYFDDDAAVLPASAKSLAAAADRLRGKPNKLEVRSWIAADSFGRPPRVREAYGRAGAVAALLEAGGVEPERVRLAVVPTPPDSDLLGADIARNGAVTVVALDAFGTDFNGPDEAATLR